MLKFINKKGNTSDATATVDDIINPNTAYVNGKKIIGSIIPEYQDVGATLYKTIALDDTVSAGSRSLKLEDYLFTIEKSNTNYIFRVIKDNKIVCKQSLSFTDLFEDTAFNNAALTYDSFINNDEYILCIGKSTNDSNGKTNVWFRRVKFKVSNNSVILLEGIAKYMGLIAEAGNTLSAMSCPITLPNIVYVSGSYHDWDLRVSVIELQWGDTATIKKLYSFPSQLKFNWSGMFATGDGYAMTNSNNFLLLNNSKTSATAITITTPVLISRNFNYMIYNKCLYSCEKLGTANDIFNSKVLIKEGLPDYNNVYFSENDTYALLVNSSNNKISVLSLQNYEIVQEINNTYNLGLPYNANCFLFSEYGTNKPLKICEYTSGKELVSLIKNGITYINTASSTIKASEILQNKVAYNNTGKITGSMPNNGVLEYTPSDEAQTILAGYTSGGTVKAMDITTAQDYKTCLSIAKNILGNTKPYTELEYIQSDGTQWCNTNYIPNNNTKYEITLSDISNLEAPIFGGGAFAGNQPLLVSQGNQLRWYYYLNYLSVTSNLTSKCTITLYRGTITYNGTTVNTNNTANGNNTSNLYIFRCIGLNSFARCKLYRFKIYENDILVRDFIPTKDISNKTGLYDLVNEKFYYSEGSKDFIAGGTI